MMSLPCTFASYVSTLLSDGVQRCVLQRVPLGDSDWLPSNDLSIC